MVEKGEQIEAHEFILNQGLPEEKILSWHVDAGFRSEDSENPQTAYNRFVRRNNKRLIFKYGQELFLQRRDANPLEKVIINTFLPLLEQVLGKKDLKFEYIYAWFDASRDLDYRIGDFLMLD